MMAIATTIARIAYGLPNAGLVAEDSGIKIVASDRGFRPRYRLHTRSLLRGDRRSRDITRYHLGVAQCADRDIVHLEPIGEHIAAVLSQ
jgi:hypothetical protein